MNGRIRVSSEAKPILYDLPGTPALWQTNVWFFRRRISFNEAPYQMSFIPKIGHAVAASWDFPKSAINESVMLVKALNRLHIFVRKFYCDCR